MDGGMKGGDFTHDNTQPPQSDSVLSFFNLKHKTAIVTGATAGIGYQVARALAEAGANVAIWYNSSKTADEKAKEIATKYGVKCKHPHDSLCLIMGEDFGREFVTECLCDTGQAYQCNVTDPEHVAAVTDKVVHDFNGRLDIFVANAGIPWTDGAALTGPISSYRKVMAVDVDGVYYCMRAAGEIWRRQAESGTSLDGKKLENYRYGSFIATASMSGHIVNIPQMQAAYNAAKAAVLHLCKSTEQLVHEIV